MPNPAITTVYDGDHIGEILQLMVVGNEAVEKGSLYIHEDVAKKREITRGFASDNLLQDYQAMPTVPSNALSFTPRYLEPRKAMVFDLINPMEFQSFWREYQPDGPLADKVLDPKIQRVITELYTKKVNNQIGRLIWQGSLTAGASSPLRFFDGYVTRAIADTAVIDVTPAGNITSSNVIAILDACLSAIPDSLINDPDNVFHMSTRDVRAYQTAVKNLTYKGQGPADTVPKVFQGKEIRDYSGFPNNYIMVCKSSANPLSSNLHMAVNLESDTENLVIERYRPEGDLYFIKANLQMDVNYAFGEEIVLYQPA